MNTNNLIKQISLFLTKQKLPFDLKALFSNRLLQQIGSGFLGLFLPIFLFNRFNYSVQGVILFYMVGYILFGLLVPLGARVMSKIGLKYAMMLGSFFLASYFLCFYYLETNFFLFLIFSLIAITLFRTIYWVPYHTDFAKFTDAKRRGRQIAFLGSLPVIAGIIIPTLSGFIIYRFGFSPLFLVAFFLIIFSILPLFLIRRVYEEYSFSYFQTFRELFKKKNRKILLGYGASGAEGVVGVVIWPVFIYQLLDEKYIAVGAVSSAIILVAVVLRLIMGKATDKMPKRFLVKMGSIFYALGWLIKTFIQTSFQIFVVGAYHNFATVIRGVPFAALIYDELADKGHYIDEYTVLREVSLNIGRVLMLIAVFVLAGFAGLNWAFVLAAVVSLFINVL